MQNYPLPVESRCTSGIDPMRTKRVCCHNLACFASIVAASVLVYLPASAQTWVTVNTLPYSPNNPKIVAYQIDVSSIFTRNGYTYAKGKMNYNREVDTLTVHCKDARLQKGSNRVYPPPYWIKRVNGFWYFDDPGSSIRGQRFEDGKYGYTDSKWMSAIFDYLCS